jgi:transposase
MEVVSPSSAACTVTAETAAETNSEEAGERVNPEGPSEIVTDKGYHSKKVVSDLAKAGVRTYCSEPQRGRQRWNEQAGKQQAVYANRRRIRGQRGKRLLRQRGEKLERWNEHLYDRGGMRRVHLRGRTNILKRLVVHAGAANLESRPTDAETVWSWHSQSPSEQGRIGVFAHT